MMGVSEPSRARAPKAAKRSQTKTGPQPTLLDSLKESGDVSGALMGVVREGRFATTAIVEAIQDSSASYEQATQQSLAAVQDRLRASDLDAQELLRLEEREDALLDRLERASKDKREEIRGAHLEWNKLAAGLGALALAGGAYLLIGKDPSKALTAAGKIATRAIEP